VVTRLLRSLFNHPWRAAPCGRAYMGRWSAGLCQADRRAAQEVLNVHTWRRRSSFDRSPVQPIAITRRSGFTLVEVIAAFAILSIVLVALLEGISTASRGDFRAELLRTSLRLAKEKLETIGTSVPLEPGVSSGTFDNGLEWTVSIRPYPGWPVTKRPSAYWVEIVVLRPIDADNSDFLHSLHQGARRPPVLTLTTLRLDDLYQ
jgi:prepilin-type N-terminal cleavage/methylation domain-containing protein